MGAITGAVISLIMWWVAFALGIAFLKSVVVPILRGSLGERKTARLLEKTGIPAVHDLYLRTADGSLTQIDHIARMGGTLGVIETKTYSGRIFGSERDRTWTQKLGTRTFKFQNPLRQNYKHVLAVREAFPDVPVRPYVVFAGGAEFGKAPPDGVFTARGFRRHLSESVTEHDGPMPAWEAVVEMSESQDRKALKADHLKELDQRFGRIRKQRTLGFLFLGAVALALAAPSLLR